MPRTHRYQLSLHWTGNQGSGTSDYRAYGRNYQIEMPGKPPLLGSSDPVFRGDVTRYTPEDLLVASLSSCHLLTYLHLCADAGIVVTGYSDSPSGTMLETGDGGHFEEVILRPRAVLNPAADHDLAHSLHEEAHRRCFIANSVNFPVRVEPEFA